LHLVNAQCDIHFVKDILEQCVIGRFV
jgi:hypothetical protein